MVYRSTEELTIRSNGTNRKASLTNRNILPMVRLVRVFPVATFKVYNTQVQYTLISVVPKADK